MEQALLDEIRVEAVKPISFRFNDESTAQLNIPVDLNQFLGKLFQVCLLSPICLIIVLTSVFRCAV
jgi:hypothetical protein